MFTGVCLSTEGVPAPGGYLLLGSLVKGVLVWGVPTVEGCLLLGEVPAPRGVPAPGDLIFGGVPAPGGSAGWPRHRENRENREFGSYFFQTGKTQGILF